MKVGDMKVGDMKVGDRVIYCGCPCIITQTWKTPHLYFKGNSLHRCLDQHVYKLKTIEWDNKYPFLDTWVSEELLRIDYLYLRGLKLKELGI